MLRTIGKIVGWTILGALMLGGLVAAIIFLGYILVWVLIVLAGIGLLIGLGWLLLKLLG